MNGWESRGEKGISLSQLKWPGSADAEEFTQGGISKEELTRLCHGQFGRSHQSEWAEIGRRITKNI